MKKRYSATTVLLMLALAGVSRPAEPHNAAIQQEASSLVDIVRRGDSELFKVSFDRLATDMRELPIGVFDSGIGGLTVLAAILRADSFDNVTHEPGPDGRPDFEHERFIYLGDQANMPYGNYSSEQKADFLRELILKDVVFLLGNRYWLSAGAEAPRHDKPPVKAIVIACNTATAYGLESINAALKEWRLPVRVIGIVDVGAAGAVRDIRERNGRGAVAVLATVGTCASNGYVRAIARNANEAGITQPTVVQQGCLGLAGAVEGDPSYISPPDAARAVVYRGPAVDNNAAPIDPELLGEYRFDADGLLGDTSEPATWKLNSVENYIRYHTATLMESHRRSGNAQPISTVLLACTHFPYYVEEIAQSLGRLRDLRATDGAEPYKDLILDNPSFIDPAELTARRLYETLTGAGLLIEGHGKSALRVGEFYISVPNASLATAQFTESGGFTYEYKYGRDPGHLEYEYVKRVPMSGMNLSQAVRDRIDRAMPGVWERLVLFSRNSPRTQDLPDSARITTSGDN